MYIVEPTQQARPALCPTCGERPTHEDIKAGEGYLTANYLCAGNHLWITRWMAGA